MVPTGHSAEAGRPGEYPGKGMRPLAKSLKIRYTDYSERTETGLCAGKAVLVPRPELYVVYTNRRETPDTLPLSGLFESAPEDGRVQHMELAVQILWGGDEEVVVQRPG